MKTSLTLLFLAAFTCAYSQKSNKSASYINTKNDTDIDYKTERLAYATDKKDTLYIKNDDCGKLIKKVWDDQKFDGSRPVIIMTNDIYAVVEIYKKRKFVKAPKKTKM